MSLFRTQIRAVDILDPDQNNIQLFAGPHLEAVSVTQATSYANRYLPYLKVTPVVDSPDTVRGAIINVPNSTPLTAESNLPHGVCGAWDGVEETALPEGVTEVDDEGIICEGDTVMLKSGGPIMTVRTATDTWCEVHYFVGHELMEITVPPACLVLINR